MLIKIIRGTYGHKVKGRIVAKTVASPPFDVSDDKATRLIRLKVAEAVAGAATPENVKKLPLKYDMTMNRAALVAIAEKLGIMVPEGAVKREIIGMIDRVINVADGEQDEDGGEDDDQDESGEGKGGEPPKFDPTPPVI